MSHFCNFYSIKMINKGIKLETNAMVESVCSGTPRPVIGRAGDAHPVLGQDALCSQDTLPFPGRRKALKARFNLRPGWWESSRRGPGSSLDEHSQGTRSRCPCQTAPPHLLRGTNSTSESSKFHQKTPQMSPQSFTLNIKYFTEETTVSCTSETWLFELKNLHRGIKFDTKNHLVQAKYKFCP